MYIDGMNQIKTTELENLAESVGRDLGISLKVQVAKYSVDLYTTDVNGTLSSYRLVTIFPTRKAARQALLAMSTIALRKLELVREVSA